jgi:hypothetical protein
LLEDDQPDREKEEVVVLLVVLKVERFLETLDWTLPAGRASSSSDSSESESSSSSESSCRTY